MEKQQAPEALQNKKLWQFWIDRGGTFTDIVARKPEGGYIIHKLLSENPDQYQDAVVEGIRKILGLKDQEPIKQNRIGALKMGTTVATNALLERKGDRTVLLINKGLGDLLRIGYQNRPKLFDLNIILPEQLYETVIEVDARISAQGEVIKPLNIKQVEEDLKKAYKAGIRSVAIALMHSYKCQDHEKIIGKLALSMGFSQVSLSHEVSPLIKLVARGDTTVVDAYLSPILRRYVEQINNKDGTYGSLMFMQSNGGLTDADLFQGKDSILSGPAGGVVGMVRTAADLGFTKLIGFDMGGTSTDVCHYDGEFERSFETEVSGIRMRAPMMNIHTVAAGGGSILTFANGRMQVGPKSAGAIPGPACYRKGGPLTVTDCNVLLGKILPDYFPQVFGAAGDQPLDRQIVVKKFKELAKKISIATKQKIKTPEELATGYLEIAVENMATAIKKISVQKGYDITKYTMNCFGGAGGQHACQIADILDMKTIYIHPYAGVLSAFGMGLADIRDIKEHQFSQPIEKEEEAKKILDGLEQKSYSVVKKQGVKSKDISIIKTAYIRPKGSQHSLPVKFDTANKMRESFAKAYVAQFGFTPPTSGLIIELLTCEAVGNTAETSQLSNDNNSVDKEHYKSKIYYAGAWQEVAVIKRSDLNVGQKIAGPLIIVDSTGTHVVDKGWQAEVMAGGSLVIRRLIAIVRDLSPGTEVDPVRLEIFNNLFMSIAEQMGMTLAKTAYSVNIKERFDFSCAIFDAKGNLVANAPHVPVHLGSMSQSVRLILNSNKGKIKPGDVYMMNNPYNGGTHLPDITVISPVFDERGENIIFTVASRGHHSDVGGTTPGSAPPDSKHIEEEGVIIDNFKMVDQGKFRDKETRELLAKGPYPCRNIDDNMADLAAQIAANATGSKQLMKMLGKYGLKVVSAYMQHVQNNAEESVRQVIDILNDSSYSYQLDSGAKIQVKITVDNKNRSATLDFTGTSCQSEDNYNAPSSICRAVVLYVFRSLVGANIPMNEGCLKPIKIILPENSMINPGYPAAVISGNTEVSQAIADTIFGALGVIAGSQGTMNNFVYGNEEYQNYETICGGAGAGKNFNGASAVHTHMTNTRMTDPEILENRFPVRLEEFSIRKDSGGLGKHKGGNGVIRALRFLTKMTVTVLSSHRITKPFGVNGGSEGLTGENIVVRADGKKELLKGNDIRQMEKDDVFIMKTPGGGGFGQQNDKLQR